MKCARNGNGTLKVYLNNVSERRSAGFAARSKKRLFEKADQNIEVLGQGKL